MNSNLARVEEIARQVMAECDRPVIYGRGHAPRVHAPRNRAVWRVLAYEELSTGRGSRCGFTAKSLVGEVLRRAAAEGIVWDWDGAIAAAQEAAARAAEYRASLDRDEELWLAAGGVAAEREWTNNHPEKAGNCIPGSGGWKRRMHKQYMAHLRGRADAAERK